MVGPITTDDLYGTSGTELPKEVPLPIPIEETPEIVAEEKTEPKQETALKKQPGCLGMFVKILMLAGLVIGGILLSNFARQFFPSNIRIVREKENVLTPTPTSKLSAVESWKTYDVVSGTTKQPFGGVTFKLPPGVLSPICDGTSCSSQGTYLPGGTRFTVAPRGAGQLLADFRGTAISDVGGITFTTKSVTVGGLPATEFTGTFTGRTVSGYAFSLMRGVMIELTPTTSLEINHFTPSGIVADFASDDVLFDQIMGTLVTPGSQSVTPVVTSTPAPTTSSGY